VRAIDLISKGRCDNSATRKRARDSTSSASCASSEASMLGCTLSSIGAIYAQWDRRVFFDLHNQLYCKLCPGRGLNLLLPMVLGLLRVWQDWMARPARLTRRNQPRSASTIAIFIKTPSVGRTHSSVIASQCFVGQTTRSGVAPRALSITWISRPVIISPQTRQYRL
jgi:hypothetical protein